MEEEVQPYIIIGETIKSATSIKLGDIFKVASTVNGQTVYTYPKRYKENITNQTYPNFHIIQVQLNPTPEGISGIGTDNKYSNRVRLDYLVNVQYRVAENTETISNLRQQLDAVGFRLVTEFTELNLERPTKVKNSYYEIVDGVLQFFFNITVFAVPQISESAKLNKYELNEEVS